MIRTARLALLWGLTVMTTGAATVAALVAQARGLAQADSRLADLVAIAAITGVGALILTIRPGHRVGVIMLASGALWGLAAPVVEWGVARAIERADPVLVGVVVVALTVRGLGWLLLVGGLALVFPDGRLPGPRWRWAAAVAAWSLSAFTFGSLCQPHPIDLRVEGLPNPLALPGAGGTLAEASFLLGFALALVAAATGLVAMGVRWRRADQLQREQLSWFALACLLVPVVMVVALLDVSTALAYPRRRGPTDRDRLRRPAAPPLRPRPDPAADAALCRPDGGGVRGLPAGRGRCGLHDRGTAGMVAGARGRGRRGPGRGTDAPHPPTRGQPGGLRQLGGSVRGRPASGPAPVGRGRTAVHVG
ncbi:hypothetical protein ACFQX7_31735 [Luedemannella flava]